MCTCGVFMVHVQHWSHPLMACEPQSPLVKNVSYSCVRLSILKGGTLMMDSCCCFVPTVLYMVGRQVRVPHKLFYRKAYVYIHISKIKCNTSSSPPLFQLLSFHIILSQYTFSHYTFSESCFKGVSRRDLIFVGDFEFIFKVAMCI